MNEKKTYKVTIFERTYSLASDEAQEHITKSAAMVDSLMRNLAEKTNLHNEVSIAVLVALQLASKLAYAESEAHMNEQQQKRLLSLLEGSVETLRSAV